ncbi:porin [Glaciimonas sp. PCH181]|uniref:porin n=1 Tax=Glaciimonas sp. PCH181 TaxID=2133943 RepID=UPI000D369001|nr:porin [Glaciimonas sp. PCH181]PUA20438.1 porin [Glaciimonas sp. PCH181]
MKKFVVGMTALCASTVSFAQIATSAPEAQAASLKIYGVADISLAQYKTSGVSKTAMHSGGSGSRIGFLGSEDLGLGWMVNARLESGVNLDTGTLSSTNGNSNRLFSRQAYIELKNNELGAVRFGRQEGPSYNFFPTYDPMLLPAMDAWGVLTTLGNPAPGKASGNGTSTGFMINPTARTENTIGYISPRLVGVQANLSYSLNEGVATQPSLLEAGLDYVAGPLQVGVLYVKAGSTPGAGAILATDSNSEIAIGAKYQAGPIQPYFSYIRRESTDPTRGAGGRVLNGNAETVKLFGLVIPVSQRGAVRITYGRYASGMVDSDATNYGMAYTYEVNPRLMLMAAVTRLTQGNAARYPVFVSPQPDAGKPVTAVTTGVTWRF